jgi:hypothetical protein
MFITTKSNRVDSLDGSLQCFQIVSQHEVLGDRSDTMELITGMQLALLETSHRSLKTPPQS